MDLSFDAKLVSSKEASAMTGYVADYITRLCRSGKIQARQNGRSWEIDRASLVSFFESERIRKEQMAKELAATRETEYRLARLGREALQAPIEHAAAPSHFEEEIVPGRRLQGSFAALALTLAVLSGGLYAGLPETRTTISAFAAQALDNSFTLALGATRLSDQKHLPASVAASGEQEPSPETLPNPKIVVVLAVDSSKDGAVTRIAVPVTAGSADVLEEPGTERAKEAPRRASTGEPSLAFDMLADLGANAKTVSDAILSSYVRGIDAWARTTPEVPSRILVAVYDIGYLIAAPVHELPRTVARSSDSFENAALGVIGHIALAYDTTRDTLASAYTYAPAVARSRVPVDAEPAILPAAASAAWTPDLSAASYSALEDAALFVYRAVQSVKNSLMRVAGLAAPAPVPVEEEVVPVSPQVGSPSPVVITATVAPAPAEAPDPRIVPVVLGPEVRYVVIPGGVSMREVIDRISFALGNYEDNLVERLEEIRDDISADEGGGGGGGGVTSVGVSGGTTGLSFSGGPVTSSGTLTLSGVLGIASGGTGTSTAPAYGQVLLGNSAGGYDLVATSSLGIVGGSTQEFSTTSANYWQTTRNFFSTTSTDYWEAQQIRWATTSSDYYLGTKSIEALSDVGTMTEGWGDLLYWNGSAWANIATSSLGLGGGATPGGSDGYIQFNQGGAFGAESGFSYASTTNTLSVTNGVIQSTSGIFRGDDEYHQIIFHNVTNSTDYFEWGDTLAAGGGHRFYTGGPGFTLRAQIADDGTYFAGPLGIGTTSPYAKLSVVGEVVGANFTATTTATSTFPTMSATRFGLGSDYFTDLTGTGLQNVGGALTLNATGDWTGTFDGQEGSYYLNRANHTGTQAASTISDFSTTARGLFSGVSPIMYNSSTGAFSWSGLATTSALSSSGVLTSNGTNGVYSTATSSATLGLGLSGSITGLGASNSLSIATSSLFSGTAGQIPYFSGTNTLTATSSVFVAANGSFGAGTTSPFALASIHANNGDTRNALFAVGSSTASATTTLFTITNAGNVGIGTAAPTAALMIVGSNGTTRLQVNPETTNRIAIDATSGIDMRIAGRWLDFEYNSDLTNAFTSAFSFGQSATNVELTASSLQQAVVSIAGEFEQTGTAAADGLLVAPTFTSLGDGSAGAGNNIFRAANGTDTKFVISTGGNVGIGTTSPYAKLSVVGEVVGASFTATTTAASRFPYASSTQFTVSSSLFLPSLSDGCASIASGILTSTGVACGSGSGGITSLGATGQGQVGASQTFSTSTGSFNGLTLGMTIVSSSNTHSFTPSVSGTLGVGGGGTGLASAPSYGQILVGNGAGYTLTATSSLGLASSFSATYPIQYSNNVLSLVFGTTTNNVWSGANNFIGTLANGSSTPFAKFSVHANSGETYTNNALFAIGSSTATATSTLFSVDNLGRTTIATSSFGSLVIDPTGSDGYAIYANNSNATQRPSISFFRNGTSNNVALQGANTTGALAAGLFSGNSGVVLTSTTFLAWSGSVSATNPSLSASPYLHRLSSNQLALGIGATSNTNGTFITENIGLGTTSPYAQLSVVATSTSGVSAPRTLFVVASTTAGTATSTLFSIGNTGTISTALGTGLVKSTAGALGLAVVGTDYLAGGAGSATTTLSASGLGLSFSANPVVFGASPITLSIATSSLYTGSTGQVAYFSGTNQMVGTSSLQISTAGNVGIGTSTPTSDLHIHSANGADISLDTVSTFSALQFKRGNGTVGSPTALVLGDRIGQVTFTGYDGSQYVTAGGSARASIRGFAAENWSTTANGTYLVLETTGSGTVTNTERMRIDQSGNIGIGTTTPVEKLSILSGDNTAGTNILAVRANNLTQGVGIGYNTVRGLGTSQNLVLDSGPGTGGTYLATNGAYRLMVDGVTGYVGIGTSTPYGNLQVAASSFPSIYLSNQGVGSDLKQWRTILDGSSNFLVQAVSDNNSTANTAMQFTRSGANTSSVLFPNGTVGVGTSTPGTFSEKLSVAGAVLASNGSTANVLLSANPGTYAALFAFNGGNTAALPLALNPFGGNIGIGTTTPAYKLQVAGSESTDGNSTKTNSSFAVTESSAETHGLYFRLRGNSAGIGGGTYENQIFGYGGSGTALYTNTGYLSLGTNSTSRLLIDGSGNVGIGTTTPEAGLSVSGSDSFGLLHLNSTSANGTVSISLRSADDANGSSGQWLIGKNLGGLSNDQFSIWQGGAGNRLTVTNAGNVGIGTSTPAGFFDIYGGQLFVTSSSYGSAELVGNSGAYIDFKNSLSDDYDARILTTGSGLNISTGAADALVITNAGNVGMGTTSPDDVNDISDDFVVQRSSANAGISIVSGNSNASTLALGDNANPIGNRIQVDNNTDAWAMYAGNAERLTILGASGNVGIGTTTPNSRLSVQGGTAEIVTTTTTGAEVLDWPTAALSIRRKDDFTIMKMLQFGHVNDNVYQTGHSVWNFSLVDETGSKNTSDNNTDLTLGGPGDLVFSTTGNVGIGDTSPSALFTVGGGDLFRVDSSGNVAFANANPTITASSYITFSGGAYFSSGTVYTEAALLARGGVADDGGVLELNDDLNVGNGDLYVINSSGNVGIGTTSPASTLHVNGTISGTDTAGAYLIKRGYNNTGLYIESDSSISTFVGGSRIMTANTSGNVGIGDASPAALLTVGSGDLFQVNSSGAIAAVTTINASGAVTASQFNGSGAGLSSATVPIASLVAGDYSGKVTSGTYSINVSGSAGTVDGIDSSQFLRSDTGDTRDAGIVTTFYNTSGETFNSLSAQRNLEIQNPSGGDAFMTFHVAGDVAGYFGLGGSENDFVVGGWSFGNNRYRVWHAGNDGASSGLDADTLDGISSASFLQATSIDTSAELRTILTDETGTGNAVFSASPTLTGTLSLASLTMSGQVLENTNAGNFVLTGLTDIYLDLDNNNDGTNTFYVRNGADGNALTLTEAGALTTAGDISVGGGTGKITVGTIDPVYTIGGVSYSTYGTGMIGVKEEVVGTADVTSAVTADDGTTGYMSVLDFDEEEEGSDLWLFAKTTDLRKHIGDLVVLLTAEHGTKVWYEVDEEERKVYLLANHPTRVSYRLTAPRFDAASWTNYNHDGITGFVPPSDEDLDYFDAEEVEFSFATGDGRMMSLQELIDSAEDELFGGASAGLGEQLGLFVSTAIKVFEGAQYVTDGIFTRIFAGEIYTDKICVTDEDGKTCLTRAELDALLAGAGAASGGDSDDGQAGDGAAEPENPSDETGVGESTEEVPPEEGASEEGATPETATESPEEAAANSEAPAADDAESGAPAS